MATQPGAPPPDIDQPISPPERPGAPSEPGQPGTPQAPDELPAETPDYDNPDPGPVEAPPPL
ncbi:hypothetical protein [Novosphingobium sp. M1R2S20]|uniref:Uncharacterized protein n=1 Tax=Novosphingobium rhizovicinum TaxID=3228928 RepID=A0ABV3R7Y9_9SPHN